MTEAELLEIELEIEWWGEWGFWQQAFGIHRMELIPNDPNHSQYVPEEITAKDKEKVRNSIGLRIEEALAGKLVEKNYQDYFPGP